MKNLSVYAGNLCATLMLSGIFIFGTLSVLESDPVLVATQRFVVATILFFGLFLFGFVRPAPITRSIVLSLVIAASFGVFLYNIFFFTGLHLSSAVSGGLIIGFTPVITVLLERIFYGSPLTFRKILGAAISFAGVCFFFASRYGLQDLFGGSEQVLGDLLYLSASFSWACYTLVMRRIVGTLDPLVATAYSVGIGAVMLCLWCYLFADLAPVGLSMLNVSVLYMALFGTVGAFVLWFRSVRQIGPSRTNIFLNFVPIFTAVLSWMFLQEAIDGSILVALAMIIVGVLIVQTAGMSLGQMLRPSGANRAAAEGSGKRGIA